MSNKKKQKAIEIFEKLAESNPCIREGKYHFTDIAFKREVAAFIDGEFYQFFHNEDLGAWEGIPEFFETNVMNKKQLLKIIVDAAKQKKTMLCLQENQLRELPPEIGQLTNLTWLDLHGNQLKELPSEIGQLTNLTRLDLSHNELKELPPEIGQLTNLTSLNLRSNQLSELPPEISQLTNLTSLSLSFNQLSELPPEISQLTNLTSLSLSFNQLKELPPEICQLTNLTKLGLDLNKNPLEIPPLEIASQGVEAIALYFEELN